MPEQHLTIQPLGTCSLQMKSEHVFIVFATRVRHHYHFALVENAILTWHWHPSLRT